MKKNTVKEIYVLRHGETLWTMTGQHTSTTDLELTRTGESQAKALGKRLRSVEFDHVFLSPLRRVRQTCKLAGLLYGAVFDEDLLEWNYGDYEGKTSEQIQEERPGWTIFTHDPPGGETARQVKKRADRLWEKVLDLQGTVALFCSGHFSRVLGARFLGFPVSCGQHLALSTASLSKLAFEHGQPVIKLWNDTSHYAH